MPSLSGRVARARLAGGHKALEPHTQNAFSLFLLGHEKHPEQVGAHACSSYHPGYLQALRCLILFGADNGGAETRRGWRRDSILFFQALRAKVLPGLVVWEVRPLRRDMLPGWPCSFLPGEWHCRSQHRLALVPSGLLVSKRLSLVLFIAEELKGGDASVQPAGRH